MESLLVMIQENLALLIVFQGVFCQLDRGLLDIVLLRAYFVLSLPFKNIHFRSIHLELNRH